jgi:hypothetical protein
MPGEVEMVGDELRNAVAYWRGRFDDDALQFPLPSSLTWTFEPGLIVEGQELGVWNWPDASTTPFFAPAGCHGAIVDTGDQLVTALFHREPAQFLLRLHS